MNKPKVFVSHIETSPGDSLQAVFKWLEVSRVIPRESRVFLKPNLTWKTPMHGVTTTPAFIQHIVAGLRDQTSRITIGESDGGYHSFKAEEGFASHGLYRLRDTYGIRVVNLSDSPSGHRSVEIGGRSVTVELPRILLDEVDVFVSLPVPKVHVMTRVSLGFKNQWGCQPGTMRLRNHPEFTRKILAIHKILKPRLAIYDGTYFLDKTGPMIGEAVRMDLVIASDDVGAADLVCCEIMGIEPRRVPHLRLAQREGMMPRSLADVTLNQSVEPFKTHQFRLRRSLINYVALAAFHSHLGTRLFYDSPAAGPIHRVLYTIRKNPFIGRLLYGRTGPPVAEGRHP